jgi:hypothetical protein
MRMHVRSSGISGQTGSRSPDNVREIVYGGKANGIRAAITKEIRSTMGCSGLEEILWDNGIKVRREVISGRISKKLG